MKCENCGAELEFTTTRCEECGTLTRQTVEGFESTKEVCARLKSMVDQFGKKMLTDDIKSISLLNDFLPEFDKERGLLKSMMDAGVLKDMLADSNPDMAVMNAKNHMLGKMFISKNAAEFVVVCFTYMLGWEYLSPLKEKEAEKETDDKPKKKKITMINIEEKVFFPIDAAKYRLFGSNISIAEGYTKIESFCFDGFKMLKTVNLPSTLLAIGDYAFSDCKNLRSINLPENLKIIRQGAFSQCVKLTVINIPKGVLEIEDNTFLFCQNLEVIEIPDTVGSIGASAFSGCEKLRKLFLPDSVKFIDNDAFSCCPDLVIHCYENSYVHKYCLANGINYETVSKGNSLRRRINMEG